MKGAKKHVKRSSLYSVDYLNQQGNQHVSVERKLDGAANKDGKTRGFNARGRVNLPANTTLPFTQTSLLQVNLQNVNTATLIQAIPEANREVQN